MVRTAKQLNKRAFTIIELIFAIVIISISVISLPMMIQVNNKSMEDSMVQEAIFAASVKLMNSSAGYWDANSMEDADINHLSRVVDIGSKCINDTSNLRHRLRPGHIAQPFHRRCANRVAGVAANSKNLDYPNLDNADNKGLKKDLFTNYLAGSTGYKKNYESQVIVSQATNRNIKHIEIKVTDPDNDDNLVTILRMQSANIGEIDYYKRTL